MKLSVQNVRQKAVAFGGEVRTLATISDDEDGDESSSEISDISFIDEVLPDSEPEFIPSQCIFCSQKSSDLEESLLHMRKSHSFFVPQKDRLVVSEQSLLKYLHLIIYGYLECLYCGTQRNTLQAVQQHMAQKGHCKMDISSEGSEFAEFYHLTSGEQSNDEEDEAEGGSTKRPVYDLGQIDDMSLRLPSGKVLSHRSAAPTHPHHRPLDRSANHSPNRNADLLPDPPILVDVGSRSAEEGTITMLAGRAGGALAKSERKELAVEAKLANLSAKDRRALMHLPVSQQRAVLATQKRQLERSLRAERRMQNRVETLGNKTLMKHFVNDVPGRALG
jgi:pre-60S factor REI1